MLDEPQQPYQVEGIGSRPVFSWMLENEGVYGKKMHGGVCGVAELPSEHFMEQSLAAVATVLDCSATLRTSAASLVVRRHGLQISGGGGGIRTPEGGFSALTAFEAVPFNRSGTPPRSPAI